MRKRGQYKGINWQMIWFFANLIIGLYLILRGLTLITIPFINDSLNNTIVVIGGALIIAGGFLTMRRHPMQSTR